MKVFFDANGKLINIGEWDYAISFSDEDESQEFPLIGNPLPAGSVESDEEVVTGWDGGLYLATDPRKDGPT
ncbi:hypothetical protein [Cupriavidus taiwanensis]|uniref:hypothetical protein n=1 Tax=Cupriavidus taiwanensis TaxID=164546 RepID=UPI000E1217A8|nr:hypothetical protein [Cupriavidus taiwanensis]SPA44595.1 hypothetical protein CBM2629_A150397 [Cupriavidus taiwanensis]